MTLPTSPSAVESCPCPQGCFLTLEDVAAIGEVFDAREGELVIYSLHRQHRMGVSVATMRAWVGRVLAAHLKDLAYVAHVSA